MTEYNFKRWIVSYFNKRHERRERRFINLDKAVVYAKRHGVDIFDCVEHVYF
jgi:hypothetical protein